MSDPSLSAKIAAARTAQDARLGRLPFERAACECAELGWCSACDEARFPPKPLDTPAEDV